eukprot:253062-Pelagomonas_calceolata.AAC.3
MQEDSVGQVCKKIWRQHFNKDEGPNKQCVSALKAILCVPGALYELSQEEGNQQTVGEWQSKQQEKHCLTVWLQSALERG